MKKYIILAVAVAAVFFATSGNADAQIKFRNKLKAENEALKERNDSLRKALALYQSKFDLADTVVIENQNDTLAAVADTATIEYSAEVSDSLLNIWYAHMLASEEEEYNMDSVQFKSNVPDEVYVERIRKMNSFITLPYNDIVKNYIILYSEKSQKRMGNIIGLCQYYMPIFDEIFSKYGLPEELKAMAVIESSMNPLAVSRVGAKGMWQFMYSTAKMYGLHIDSFVDERLDPIKSAEAAAMYLRDSYEIFGDWNLAIASYNCGAGNVKKAIRRSGSRAFWDIWPFLPRETRGYVPAFVGALYAMTYYKEHGIKPEYIEMPAVVDTFKITKQLHLRQVADLTGAPLEELKNLNPQYRHEIIPGHNREYILRLNYKYTNAFIDNEDSLYRHKTAEYFNPVTIKKIKDGGDGETVIYRVKSGDVLGKIAMQYRCSVSQIKRWNNLKSNNIRVGQRLVLYRGGKGPAPKQGSSSSQTSQSKPSTQMSSDGKYLIYTIQEGDSFYSIAKNYSGVSAQNIMDFNGLSSSKIKPGMKIKIPILK